MLSLLKYDDFLLSFVFVANSNSYCWQKFTHLPDEEEELIKTM